jgi:predicted amidohydrolase
VVAAAQGGAHENGRSTYGHSMIIDPWGEVLAKIDGDQPGVIVADIDPARVTDVRGRVPSLANARAFSLSVNDRGASSDAEGTLSK